MRGSAEREFEAPTPTEASQRDYLKCSQCRRDGKKCVPRNDSTNTPASKCFRCARLGHPCGPRERAPGRARGRVTSIGSGISNSSTSQTNRHELPQPDSHMLDRTQNAICSNSAFDLSDLVELVALSRLRFRHRCELTLLLKRIPHDVALIQRNTYLRSCATRLDAQYQAYVQKFMAEIDHQPYRTDTVSASNFDVLRLMFEVLQVQHLRLDAAVRQPDSETVSRQSGPWFSPINSPLREWALLRCTERIAAGVDPVSLQLRQGLSNVKSIHANEYGKTQALLACILGRICNQNHEPEHEGPSLASVNGTTGTIIDYPAAHLAYWNFDKDTAFEIATCSGTLELPIDTMNQTLIHIAVKARDIGFLKRLVDFDSDAFVKASAAPGHTPLDLATILDDRDIFALLIGRGANLSPWTDHLLDLAVAANSPSIVDVILERGMIVLPPYTKVAAAAIEKGLEDIALRFVQWLQPCWTDRWELEMLLLGAQQMHLHRLVAALRTLAPIPILRSNPVGSLRQHLAFLTAGQAGKMPGTDPPSSSSFDYDDAWSNSETSYSGLQSIRGTQ